MIYQAQALHDDQWSLAKLPGWVTARAGETPQNVAFLSGATFAILDTILRHPGESIPKQLLRNTLALKVAVATSKLEGRMTLERDLRDAYHLTPPDGDGVRHWGPDGDVLDFWRRAGGIRLSGSTWFQPIGVLAGDHWGGAELVGEAMSTAARDGPLPAALEIMTNVLDVDDRAERVACLLADIVIAKSLAWDRLLPITARHLTKADLRGLKDRDEKAHLSIQRSVIKSAQEAFRCANELSARAAALRSVAPRLRSRGSDDAIGLFLTEDAVAPSGTLSPQIRGTRTAMTGRAARRLCDRLVELGVVRELTGRPTFRLYGVGS